MKRYMLFIMLLGSFSCNKNYYKGHKEELNGWDDGMGIMINDTFYSISMSKDFRFDSLIVDTIIIDTLK